MDITPIKSQRDYRRVLREIEGLMSARRNTPEGDRLDVLVTTAAIWTGTPLGALVSVPLFIAGSLLANRIWHVVAVPTRAGVVRLTALAGLAMPALTGIVDLALRARIP